MRPRLLAARALERRSLLALRDRSARDQPAAVPLTYGDPALATVVEDLRKVARTHATVLLLGDSGTGKEVAARRPPLEPTQGLLRRPRS